MPAHSRLLNGRARNATEGENLNATSGADRMPDAGEDKERRKLPPIKCLRELNATPLRGPWRRKRSEPRIGTGMHQADEEASGDGLPLSRGM